jgi:hypothetical protein
VLVRVEVEGVGMVCHRGTRSCFTEELPWRTAQSAAGKETA